MSVPEHCPYTFFLHTIPCVCTVWWPLKSVHLFNSFISPILGEDVFKLLVIREVEKSNLYGYVYL